MSKIIIEEITEIYFTEETPRKPDGSYRSMSSCLKLEDDGWHYFSKTDMCRGFESKYEEDIGSFLQIARGRPEESEKPAQVLRSYLQPIASQLGLNIDKLGPLWDLTVRKMVERVGRYETDIIDECMDVYSREDGPWIFLERDVTKQHHEWF